MILSIIVPVYNVETYINRCILSIFKQTIQDFELILVDDASPDNCPRICDEYAITDSRVKVVHKQNGGLGKACNSGINIAQGDYIAFCDSDDWIDPMMYNDMLNIALLHSADMVFSGLRMVDDSGNTLGLLPHPNTLEVIKGDAEIKSFLRDFIASSPEIRVERPVQVSAKVVLYKQSLISDNNIRFVSERELPSEDLTFNIRAIANSSCICVSPCFYYNYRINPNSISHTVNKNEFYALKKLYKYMINECQDLQVGGDVVTRIQRVFIGFTRSHTMKILKSQLKWSEKKLLTNEIFKDYIWTDIYNEYPISKMPLIHRVCFLAQKNRCLYLLTLISKIK